MHVHALTVLLLGSLLSACGESRENKQAQEQAVREHAEKERETRKETLRNEFAARHKGDVAWLNQIETERPLTTLLLETALIRNDGKPIVVPVRLLDIGRDKERYHVLFYASELMHSALHRQQLLFETTCTLTASEVEEIQPREYMSFYAPQPADHLLALRATAVRQTHLFVQLQGEATTLGLFLVEYIVTGECLGLRRMTQE